MDARICKMVLAAAAGLGLAACASLEAEAPAPRTVAVSELIDLTPNEVRAKLGIRRAKGEYASEVVEEPAGRILVLTEADLMQPGYACPDGMVALLGPGGPRSIRLRFVAGRLTDVKLPNRRGVSTLEVECRPESGSGKYFPPLVAAGIIVLASPLLLVGATQQAAASVERGRAAAALSRLRLGAPPPGGLESYARRPPYGFAVIDQGDAGAEVRARLTDREVVYLEIRQGKVVAIRKGFESPCELKRDALHC